MCNEIKDKDGNIIVKFYEDERILHIINFNKINSMKFTNPYDQIMVEVQNVKKYKDYMLGKNKYKVDGYLTNYINLETLPLNIQDKITKFTMEEYSIKKEKKNDKRRT